MPRWSVYLVNAILAASLSGADETLPQDPEAMLEIEPPVLIHNRAAFEKSAGSDAPSAADPELELARLEKDLARAKRNAEGGERLYKSGIIAKADAEARALKVVQLSARVAEARLAEVKRKAAERAPNESNATAAVSVINSTVAQAAEAAERATEERKRAELEAALRNLQRQQKLLALGSGRKSDVSRAEQKVAELQRPQN